MILSEGPLPNAACAASDRSLALGLWGPPRCMCPLGTFRWRARSRRVGLALGGPSSVPLAAQGSLALRGTMLASAGVSGDYRASKAFSNETGCRVASASPPFEPSMFRGWRTPRWRPSAAAFPSFGPPPRRLLERGSKPARPVQTWPCSAALVLRRRRRRVAPRKLWSSDPANVLGCAPEPQCSCPGNLAPDLAFDRHKTK